MNKNMSYTEKKYIRANKIAKKRTKYFLSLKSKTNWKIFRMKFKQKLLHKYKRKRPFIECRLINHKLVRFTKEDR